MKRLSEYFPQKPWISLILILLGGAYLTYLSARHADSSNRKSLISKGDLYASVLDKTIVHKLSVEENTQHSYAWNVLRSKLVSGGNTNTELLYLYIMTQSQTSAEILIAVHNVPENSPIALPPNTIYSEAPEPVKQMFAGSHQSVTHGPWKDRWGSYVSAFIPLVDPKTGTLTGVLGIDISVTNWYFNIVKECILPVLITILACFLVFWNRLLKKIIDIRTDRLTRTERELQAIFDHTFQFIATLTPEGTLKRVNVSALSFIEQPLGSVIGRKFWDTPWWHGQKEMQPILKQALTQCAKGKFYRKEVSHTNRDGNSIYVDFSLTPIFDKEGEVVLLLAEGRDMTELHRLRNYASKIINCMPSILIGVNNDGRVTQWNTTAEQVTGIRANDAHGKKISDVLPRMSEDIENIQKSIQSGKVIQEQRRPRTSENGTCYDDITIYPLISDDEKSAVIRIDDVTEKMRMEEMMIQSEKMLSIGGLAAGMAHEINNPLAGMLQTASVMKSRLENTQMAANIRAAEKIGISMHDIRLFMEKRGIFSMMEAITNSGQRLAEIVNNMLSFARKPDAAVSSHDPAKLVDQVLEIAATDYDLKKKYDFKTIKIIKEYGPDLPLLPCEKSKIQQVLLNILHNGAQAMQAEDRVKENPPCFTIKLSVENRTNMLIIEIQDNGPGMDQEVSKRIFEPFFTTKPPGIGTGLGLSVSYFIVTKNHGGIMDVESSPGKGATFIIRLPLERQIKQQKAL